MNKLRIGVIGSATNKTNIKLRNIAQKLGKLLGSTEFEIVTGAAIGVPHKVLLKAKKHGIKSIGFSPDPSSKKHKKRHDNASLADFNKLFFHKGFSRRSAEFITSCDVVIVIGGRIGTLSEYAMAFEENKPIGVLTGTGGISDHLKSITQLCNKHREVPVYFSRDIEKLFQKLLACLKKDQWNKLAEDYKNFTPVTSEKLGYAPLLNMVKHKIKGSIILDYGSGFGKFSKRIAKYNPKKIWAVDNCADAIELVEKSESIVYKHINSGDLNFIKNKSVDLAFANFVFCCIKERSEIKKILKEIYKKLKKDGELIILDPHPDSPGYKYFSFTRDKPKKLISGTPLKVKLPGMKTPVYDYWRPKKEYIDLLTETGFEITEIKEPKLTSPDKILCKDEAKQAPQIIIRARKN